MKGIISLFCILIFISCGGTKNNNKTTKPAKQKTNTELSINKPSVIETDKPSFNPETGEFIADEYTIGLWHFNEGKEEFAFDESKYENDGLILKPRWSDGPFSKCLNLNGSNNGVEIDDENLNLSTNHAITVEGWFFLREKQRAPYPTLIGKPTISESDGKPNYILWIVNHQHDQFPNLTLYWGVTPIETNKLESIDSKVYWKELAGKWHYIVGTFNGETLSVYVDGILKAKKKLTKNSIIKTANKPLYIGKIAHQDIDALVDEIRISNVARSEKAIKQYYQYASKFLKK